MKMYRANGLYHATQDQAKKAAKAAGCDFEAVEVPVKQADLVEYLNALVVERPTASTTITNTFNVDALRDDEVMPLADELWSRLGLGMRLLFAAETFDEAAREVRVLLSVGEVKEPEAASDAAENDCAALEASLEPEASDAADLL